MITELSTTGTNLTATPDYYNWWQLPNSPEYHYHYTQPAITYQIVRPARCTWCQGMHEDKCPRLKAVIYRDNGTVERVEFFEEEQ